MPRKPNPRKRHAVEDHNSGSELNMTSSRRQKRGKYVSQACDQCQQRKIKCDGLPLCTPCAVYGRTCGKRSTDMRRRSARNQTQGIQDRGSTRRRDSLETTETVRSHSTMPLNNSPKNHGHEGSLTTHELAARLEHLEQLVHHKLGTLASHSSVSVHGERDPDAVTATHPGLRSEGTRPDTTPRQKQSTQVQRLSFSGETSIQYTLKQVEGHLVNLDHRFETTIAVSPDRMSTPALTPPSSPSGEATSRVASDLHRLLDRHGIAADKAQWDRILHTFCNEIHIMYPLLHLPTLWHRYTEMWTTWSLADMEPCMLISRHKQFAMAQILICLATGRCTASPRIAGAEARHSAGWSLYRAAAELVGDILDCFEECPDQILVLQTLALMVIYLFRLDIIGRAEKLLAIAISHAHYLGLHRSLPVVDGLKPSDVEINRRLWWCLYTMDRRLAIDTGRPFLIQDMNVNTQLPQGLDDDCLFYRQVGTDLSLASAPNTLDRANGAVTPIPYLAAMVTYSRVLGKVWEGMYGADSAMQSPPRNSRLLREHFEHLISRAQREVPPEFVYHFCQQESQSKKPVGWLVKQQKLMRVRWLSLRLLIRRPMLQETTSSPAIILTGLDNERICAQIASDVMQECIEISEEQTIFTYPFFHYLLSAAIISIGLIIKQPSCKDAFGDIALKAIQVLEFYPRRTRISGKLIRNVSKLGHIVRRVMAHSAPSEGVHTSCLFANRGYVSRESAERSFECADRGESVVQEMQWLEALFGNYLDSNLIVRPGE
ncbi:hypothetical protein ASPACDRAFT_111253 [Aspergillus aculeatus ATCC 16872]|uniref:Zn(2)-C6 fungal-type domain-containing protein n=1 Tax=Aspergillus aculeatus (strain ATCC 16872 / CBS 172.66 / WB 5094) TaxID=690307 RepID=A0A1L9X4R2_ASPA1|nr:uncharacterized protein ASPACDRAFT_111253 [Aspergillus aculeatus ATCC 16872]OJK03456.1 hypothetical protein ASPACDRAFT_111253 [Aspergillus aculeatus ATCC 16872]